MRAKPAGSVRSVVYDLHTHTVFSDGTTTPEENAALAAEAGLAGLALTDHDTTAGWERAATACAAHGLTFVPGIELSTEHEGFSVHVLGYWPDPEHPGLVAECDRLRNERTRRMEEIVALLGDLGVDVPWERVLAHAGEAPLGRPHVAAVLVELGVVPDTTAAFERYLADGGPAYVEKHAVAPAEGVALIRDAGGVPVLAHPGGETQNEPVPPSLLDGLIDAGLAGLEADHPSHDADAAASWRAVADERGLLSTGCSDYHGANKDVELGERTTPDDVVAALAEHSPRARRLLTPDRLS